MEIATDVESVIFSNSLTNSVHGSFRTTAGLLQLFTTKVKCKKHGTRCCNIGMFECGTVIKVEKIKEWQFGKELSSQKIFVKSPVANSDSDSEMFFELNALGEVGIAM